jgi:hypothetical protein
MIGDGAVPTNLDPVRSIAAKYHSHRENRKASVEIITSVQKKDLGTSETAN